MIDLDPSGDPHAAAEAAELRRDLAAALIDLPFKYRAAVVLRHVMGLDYAEAARELDLPLNTFKSHLLRGTRLLREASPTSSSAPRSTGRDRAGRPRASPVQASGNGRRPGDVLVGSEQPLRH